MTIEASILRYLRSREMGCLYQKMRGRLVTLARPEDYITPLKMSEESSPQATSACGQERLQR